MMRNGVELFEDGHLNEIPYRLIYDNSENLRYLAALSNLHFKFDSPSLWRPGTTDELFILTRGSKKRRQRRRR